MKAEMINLKSAIVASQPDTQSPQPEIPSKTKKMHLAFKRIDLGYFVTDVGRMDTLREAVKVKKIYKKSTGASSN